MKSYLVALATTIALFLGPPSGAAAVWTEGQHYFLLDTAPRTALAPGKVEVTEVFSYGCPACAQFNPLMRQLRQTLPANVHVSYVAAGFVPAEDWPMLQRAYCTAEALGIAEKMHDAMFDAVWKTGELAILDPATHRPKTELPTIEDAARFYSRHAGIKAEDFVAKAKSFTIDSRIRAADDYIKTYRVVSTPTIIVNGKYRMDGQSAGGFDQLIELIKWLVAKESK
jgi:thiol:disulfide interchange protein DsbA